MDLRDRAFYADKNIFFITTTCHEWFQLLVIGDSIQIVSESLDFCCNKYSSKILGYVIMPNHVHLILYFLDGSKRTDFMRDFKKFTSTKIRQEVEREKPAHLDKLLYMKREQVFKVWQDRFDEVYLESPKLLEIKLDYIHNNPLQERWNLAKRPEEYPNSSAFFYETGNQNLVEVTHYLDFV